MATSSEVKAGMDNIAQSISSSRAVVKEAIELLGQAKESLNGIPANYADVLATITAYVPTGEAETLYKDELANMTVEFLALVAEVEGAETELAGV